ncbi:hypothetical protein AVEN_63273-1 [Araneus ventricosus]|uniref:Uncharacterized protein n=1 Tax=Araneus ventricosus TaxID=182803 RepID=A0A4Y2K4W6_ARAVE|nr:hypothetical protein AVEN_63273-1 [Araneus ventricosus]
MHVFLSLPGSVLVDPYALPGDRGPLGLRDERGRRGRRGVGRPRPRAVDGRRALVPGPHVTCNARRKKVTTTIQQSPHVRLVSKQTYKTQCYHPSGSGTPCF